MDVKKEKYCRLCFKMTENGYEIIDDVTKLMLGLLMIELNWDLIGDPVICQECAETTKKSYYFKVTYIDKTNYVGVKDDEFSVKTSTGNWYTETANLEDFTVCGFCTGQVKADQQFSMDVLLKDSKLAEICSVCMPEREPDVIKTTTCVPCGENFKTYFNFVYNCLDVEKKINTYIKNKKVNGSMNQVNLSNIHNFLLESIKEPSHMSIVDVKQELDISEGCKQLEIPHESLKCEEIDIKDQTNLKMYKCASCTYETNCKSNLKRHMQIHRSRSEMIMYNCESCTFETKRRGHLKRHMLIHNDNSEMTTYECESCPFKTRRKDSLKRHMLHHTNLSDSIVYKCECCTFGTKSKSTLKLHSQLHEDNTEVETYKCESCTFETKSKCYLRKHMLIHKDSADCGCDNVQM